MDKPKSKFAPCQKKKRRVGSPATQKQILESLERNGGIVALAARELGYATSSLRDKIGKDPILKLYRKEHIEVLLDEAEKGLLEKVREGDMQAIKFALTTVGRSRGYSERLELTGKDGGALFANLSIYERKMMEEAGMSAGDVFAAFMAEVKQRVSERVEVVPDGD